MIIHSVKLHNIRSYVDEKIDFPEGTILLSGDIGSGKSSILLAIEFALFGIMRGGLPGTALLRYGEKEGHVELRIEIENKDIIIHRELSRSGDSVTQDSGWIMINGQKQEGTPRELKSKVIELLGYPQELVTKSKSLIYRYTVYTPQEEMKQILLEGAETRLDTLRKIFNIDKYKRIKENSALLARELRSEKKLLKRKLEDLDELKEKLEDKKEEKEEKKSKKGDLEEKIEELKEEVREAKKRVGEAEEKAEERNQAEKKYEVTKSNLKDKKQRLEENEKSQQKIRKDLKELKDELEDKGAERLEEVESRIEKLEKKIKSNEETLSQVREKEATRKAQKKQAQEIKDDIKDLDECPVCRQEVTEQHKKDVFEEQDEKIEEAEEKLEKAQVAKKKLKQKNNKLESKLKKLREEEKQLASVKEKKKRLEEKQEKEEELEDKGEELQESIEELQEKKMELEEELEETEDLAEELKEVKETYEEKREEMNDVKIKHTKLETEVEGLQESITELEEELDEMNENKEKLDGVKEKLEWLDDYFVKTVDVMEKQVMLRIYNEFNEYFVEWFNTLMEEETLNVRLDDQFAPVITQDGYESTIDNLSGGERTSVALAYRLSLNKVINDFIGTIKTKDIIILDEPTDGFSTDQLDKVRDVLRELDIRQILIVSHEAKMETYVDNVIEIAKQNNQSRVVR